MYNHNKYLICHINTIIGYILIAYTYISVVNGLPLRRGCSRTTQSTPEPRFPLDCYTLRPLKACTIPDPSYTNEIIIVDYYE